jgi:hypothetical protein
MESTPRISKKKIQFTKYEKKKEKLWLMVGGKLGDLGTLFPY